MNGPYCLPGESSSDCLGLCKWLVPNAPVIWPIAIFTSTCRGSSSSRFGVKSVPQWGWFWCLQLWHCIVRRILRLPGVLLVKFDWKQYFTEFKTRHSGRCTSQMASAFVIRTRDELMNKAAVNHSYWEPLFLWWSETLSNFVHCFIWV